MKRRYLSLGLILLLGACAGAQQEFVYLDLPKLSVSENEIGRSILIRDLREPAAIVFDPEEGRRTAYQIFPEASLLLEVEILKALGAVRPGLRRELRESPAGLAVDLVEMSLSWAEPGPVSGRLVLRLRAQALTQDASRTVLGGPAMYEVKSVISAPRLINEMPERQQVGTAAQAAIRRMGAKLARHFLDSLKPLLDKPAEVFS